MTRTNSQLVQDFFDACAQGKEQMHEAVRTYFAPDATWENVGITTTTGPEEAIEYISGVEGKTGIVTFGATMVSIAEQGDRVLTERVDHLYGDDGTIKVDLRLMGVFEIADGRITAWRDYFDTAPFPHEEDLQES